MAGGGGALAALTAPIRHDRVDLGDVELHVAAAGDPDAPLTILLHGFPEFWYMWKDLLAALGGDRLAVAPDQRGYARSDKPGAVEAYRIEALVADVAGLADRLGKERFTLVAHDWGGVVAWALAAALPDRLRGLVAINAPHPALFARERRESPAQKEASAYIDLLVSPMAEAALAAGDFARLFDGLRGEDGASRLSDEDREAYREAWSEPGALTGMVSWYRAAGLSSGGGSEAPAGPREGGAGAPAGRIEVPTLVLWGERDRYLTPGVLDGLEDLVDDLEVVRVADAGHWIVREKPELVRRAVEGFLDRVEAAGGPR